MVLRLLGWFVRLLVRMSKQGVDYCGGKEGGIGNFRAYYRPAYQHDLPYYLCFMRRNGENAERIAEWIHDYPGKWASDYKQKGGDCNE